MVVVKRGRTRPFPQTSTYDLRFAASAKRPSHLVSFTIIVECPMAKQADAKRVNPHTNGAPRAKRRRASIGRHIA
jgi:hypothetical protein